MMRTPLQTKLVGQAKVVPILLDSSLTEHICFEELVEGRRK